jgi:hypothetical protein
MTSQAEKITYLVARLRVDPSLLIREESWALAALVEVLDEEARYHEGGPDVESERRTCDKARSWQTVQEAWARHLVR